MSLGREDERRLLQHRRLVLLVDLDQTLIHTTNEDIQPNLKNVHHFQVNKSGPWRPSVHSGESLFPNVCGLPFLLFFWLKWAEYLAVAGLNLLT